MRPMSSETQYYVQYYVKKKKINKMTEHFQLKTPTKLLNYNILKKSRILYPTEVAKF